MNWPGITNNIPVSSRLFCIIRIIEAGGGVGGQAAFPFILGALLFRFVCQQV